MGTFWKIHAKRYGHGHRDTAGIARTYYVNVHQIDEVHDMPLTRSNGAQIAVVEVHYSADGKNLTGRYEIADKTASEVVKELEAFLAPPAAPAEKPSNLPTNASLGRWPLPTVG